MHARCPHSESFTEISFGLTHRDSRVRVLAQRACGHAREGRQRDDERGASKSKLHDRTLPEGVTERPVLGLSS